MAQSVVVSEQGQRRIGRRRFVVGAFWASMGTLAVAAGASVANSLWPRGVTGFGGPVAVAASDIPKPGDPPRVNQAGRFWLVNLEPGEGQLADGAAATSGGLVALWRRCPHLGCSVPWSDSLTIPDDERAGWFRCPCHASTYTKAGVRVFGPAPRSMDTMRIDVVEGGIVVQTGDRTPGGTDNVERAVRV